MQDDIHELQARIAFQDDAIEQLNQVILRQQQAIETLELRVEGLVMQLDNLKHGDSEKLPRHEVPPHY